MEVIFLSESTARACLYATNTRESEGLCSSAGVQGAGPLEKPREVESLDWCVWSIPNNVY